MSFTATVENDTIKLPPGVHLPDGTKVSIEPEAARGLHDWMLKYAGIADDVPADLASEHDHYLYGTPKRGDRA